MDEDNTIKSWGPYITTQAHVPLKGRSICLCFLLGEKVQWEDDNGRRQRGDKNTRDEIGVYIARV